MSDIANACSEALIVGVAERHLTKPANADLVILCLPWGHFDGLGVIRPSGYFSIGIHGKSIGGTLE